MGNLPITLECSLFPFSRLEAKFEVRPYDRKKPSPPLPETVESCGVMDIGCSEVKVIGRVLASSRQSLSLHTFAFFFDDSERTIDCIDPRITPWPGTAWLLMLL